MKDIVWQSFQASLAGGLLSLDRTAAIQIMISRPIVTAPIIGYILGDAIAGLLIGGVLELLWIGQPPVGGYIPSHETMLAVLVTAISIIGKGAFGRTGFDISGMDASILFFLGFAVLMALPMDMLCKRVDISARVLNKSFFHAASSGLDKGSMRGILTSNLKGLGVFFLLNFFTIFVLSLTGILALSILLPSLPSWLVMSLLLACGALVVASLCSAYNAVYDKRSLPVFLGTAFFLLVTFLL